MSEKGAVSRLAQEAAVARVAKWTQGYVDGYREVNEGREPVLPSSLDAEGLGELLGMPKGAARKLAVHLAALGELVPTGAVGPRWALPFEVERAYRADRAGCSESALQRFGGAEKLAELTLRAAKRLADSIEVLRARAADVDACGLAALESLLSAAAESVLRESQAEMLATRRARAGVRS